MKRIAAILTLIPLALQTLALNLSVTPGSLSSSLEELDGAATSLNIIGKIDARDLAALRDIPEHIKILNLGTTEVVAYTGSVEAFAPQTVFPAGYLPEHLLFGTHLTEIYLPRNITSMGAAICSGSPNLTTAGISEGTTVISDYAFYNCPLLSEVYIPSALTYVGWYAMAKCPSLTLVNLSATHVTEFPEALFKWDNSLTQVLPPVTLSSIGSEAFYGTAIRSLNVASVSEYADYAFAGMPSLIEITLNPDAEYGLGVLMNDSALTDISGLPTDVPDLFVANSTNAGAEEIASQASSLGKYALANLPMDSVILSPGLRYVDQGAFANTNGLQMLDASLLGENVPDTHPEAFRRMNPSQILLRVAKGTAEVWRQHPTWGLLQITSIGTSVSQLADNADALRISIAGNILRVTAPEAIAECAIWSADGRLLGSWHPVHEEFETSLDGLREHQGVVVVKVTLVSGQTKSAAFL